MDKLPRRPQDQIGQDLRRMTHSARISPWIAGMLDLQTREDHDMSHCLLSLRSISCAICYPHTRTCDKMCNLSVPAHASADVMIGCLSLVRVKVLRAFLFLAPYEATLSARPWHAPNRMPFSDTGQKPSPHCFLRLSRPVLGRQDTCYLWLTRDQRNDGLCRP